MAKGSAGSRQEQQTWLKYQERLRQKAKILKEYDKKQKLKELDDSRKKHVQGNIENEGQWITVKGRHVFIKKGEKITGALFQSKK